jgi:nicotinate phosphoribosyltransferase
LEDEPPPPGARALLWPVVRGGAVLPGSLPPISEIWEHARASLAELPERYQQLSGAPAYPVEMSAALQALREQALRHENGHAAAATATSEPESE